MSDRRRLFVLLASAAILSGLGLSGFAFSATHKTAGEWGLSAFAKYVTIPGATRVGSKTCVNCHSDLSSNFSHAFHAQQGLECEDCHGPGSLHVAGNGDVSKIISFSTRSAKEANGVCLSCHVQDEKLRAWMAGPHASNAVRCTDCHQIHAPALRAANTERMSFDTSTRGAFRARLVSPETNVAVRTESETNEACLKCHPTENAQMSMPYHHPLREGKMSCVDCHDPHGGPTGNNLRMASTNELCLSCHAQYRGPFAYQHPPVTENCLICHTPHGSPNTNLLTVSEPALCLQCHAGHHNGAGTPLTDRCTDCHGSIHGTDVPTPSGGSRFTDKGPTEAVLRAGFGTPALVPSHSAVRYSGKLRPAASHLPMGAVGAAVGEMGLMSQGLPGPLSGGNSWAGSSDATAETQVGDSAYSFTPGSYQFVDGTGYLGRAGEYNSSLQSAGGNGVAAYVSPEHDFTIVSRADFLTRDEYSTASQVAAGKWLQAGVNMRGFIQQQDHYPFYAFPVLDVPPGSTTPPDTTTDLIPPQVLFGLKRRLGSAYARVKVPNLPVHVFVNGGWQARVGESQLAYLDENTTAAVYENGVNTTCGDQCHYSSQFQPVNYTTRNIGGGLDVKLHQASIRWEHQFSSFNDRLVYPAGIFTGPFTPENEGISSVNPPPAGPAPPDVAAGGYPIDIPSPSQASSDTVSLNWNVSPDFSFSGSAGYTRLRDLLTHYPQNSFDSDATLNWRPVSRLQIMGDYLQQNVVNNFTPYYSLYGNVSYHNHSEGVRINYGLPKGFAVDGYYRRSGTSRSNAFLWPQIYSMDNTDLSYVVPSSFSNTTGLALRYHDRSLWSARAGYEWTGTHDPGYLIVPQSNNRVFADFTLTPVKWLVFDNDTNIIVQNAFPAVALPNSPGQSPDFGAGISGLPPAFQRRNRFYYETASVTLPVLPAWNLGFGYSYQQNNLATYMSFQNDASTGYVLDEPLVPYKQITQAYWGQSSYTLKQNLGLDLRLTYNSARSGFRPDVNPSDAALLGNQSLIASGAFDPVMFSAALANLELGATQVSEVIVPQWIGQSKLHYDFPHNFELGLICYYGSYRDYFNPDLNGVLRTFNVYFGRSW